MVEGRGTDQLSLEQGTLLLRTKLFIPPVRASRVTRPGLFTRINHNLDKALILISAPAGFGKTTLLAEWAAQAGMPVGWLSLDAGDNDPNRFLRYVIAALETALTDQNAAICKTAKDLLQSVQPIPIQTTLVALINDLTDIPEPFSLVLDDYQFITNPAVNEALTFFLEHLPPHMHLIVASRVDPSIPLHRLRAAQRLLEIRTEDLRFSGDEAGTLMNTVMALGLSKDDISTLTDRTEGWVVGLQMAALSMQSVADRPAFVQAFSGSHRYILEYLIEEVLSRQPKNIQTFLLRTSILERLCSPLCNKVLEDQGDSPAILEYLDRHNIFLTPLDQVGYWYRYHHLFADLLRIRLQQSQPEQIQTLHMRASQWFEEAGLPEQAIGHAFSANEHERAAWLIERNSIDIMSRGEMSSLLGLFAALTEDQILHRPRLCLLRAWAFSFSGQIEKVEPQLQVIEKQIRPGDTTGTSREILGSIAIIRGLMADLRGEMDSAIELAGRADQLLPEENLLERSIIPFVLGDGYTATGELDKAELAFVKIKNIGQLTGNLWTTAVALHKLALLKKLQGKLRVVWNLYQDSIQLAGERGGQQYGSMGATYVGLSDLLRERNELELARQIVTRAIQNMENWHSPTDMVNGYITLARIAMSREEINIARDALKKAEEISSQGNIFPLTRKTLEACQIRMSLVAGDKTMVDGWVKSQLSAKNLDLEKQSTEEEPITEQRIDYLRELEWITLARALLSRGELASALKLLTSLAKAAEASGRNGRLIEILNLMILALYVLGKKDQALNVLIKSLTLAEPEGYLRIFLDEGRPFEELLRFYRGRVEGHLKDYIDKLLEAFSEETGRQERSPSSNNKAGLMIELLTGREVEVLRLLSAGLSNQEIAERLVLSEGTVKTHTHNLYGKLGVQSRTRALARAKELNLI